MRIVGAGMLLGVSAVMSAAVTGGPAAGQSANCSGVYSDKVQPIFDVNCVVCHQDANPLGNLSLQRSSALTNTVKVNSDELPAMPRITPGNDATSYLMHKLLGTQVMAGGSGDRMPYGAAPLSDSDVATIKAWIVGCMASS